jgi:cytochrome c oxidase cbb3-type subunit 3
MRGLRVTAIEPDRPELLNTTAPGHSTRRRVMRWGALVIGCLLLLAGLTAYRAQRGAIEARLLTTLPSDIPHDAALMRFANAQGAPLFAQHCASCHGADMRGNKSTGAPNLVDGVWLFGEGSIFEIERTILFGIRTGLSNSRDVTEMPAFGQRGLLTDAQMRDVVQYVLKLSDQPHREDAATEGRRVFETGDSACIACHGDGGQGDTFSGASDLTANVWNYGGDEKSLYDTVYFGRRGTMPGWFGVLSLEQIRTLAVYVYSMSHPES